MNEKSLYLYCLADGEGADAGGGSSEEDLRLEGIEGGGIFAFVAGGLVAIVQECEGPFSSEDKETVSQWVLTHQRVIELAWEKYGTVIPCCFDTIILPNDGKTARENLIAWLGQEKSNLKEKLKKLAGKVEYGVQISWDPTVIATKVTRNDRQIEDLEQEIKSKGSGTAYLLKQKLETVLRKRLEMAADAYFKEFYQKVDSLVEEVRVERVRNPPEAPACQPSGRDRQMLLNLSCLLPKDETPKLGDELGKISKMHGFYVRFTGPWPPYSFV